MKKLLLLLPLLLLAAAAHAQEAYSISATANQVNNLTDIVTTANARTCLRLTATEICTQAAACTAANAPGGSSCTAAQARGANARIYPLTQAGREEFVTFVFVAPQFIGALGDPVAFEFERACANWTAFTNTQKNSACQALGRTASTVAVPCRLCP